MKRNILIVSLVLMGAVLLGCEEVDVDVKPQSCPNPVNVKSKGVIPVAILGTDSFDVCDVNVSSILLFISEDPCDAIEAIAGRIDYNDVSAPVVRDQECDCNETGPDTYEDLIFYFHTQEVIAGIEGEIGPLEDGEELPMVIGARLSGNNDPNTFDIVGHDCILIRKKGRGN